MDAALAVSRGVLVRDLAHAATVVDDLAPEHLLMLLADPEAFLETVSVAGAIFLGEWSAVPFGDYGVASNHVLPTSGTARFSSGLRASDYVTVRSVVQMSKAAAARHAGAAAAIANAEGLVGHAKAVEARRDGREHARQPPARPPRGRAVRLSAARRRRSPEHERVPVAAAHRILRRPRRRRARAAAEPLPRRADDSLSARRSPARTGHPVDGVWTANGSNEILTQLLMAYGGAGRRAALFEPTYMLHRRLCWLTQTEIAERRLEPPFEIDDDAIAVGRRFGRPRRVRLLAEQPDREHTAARRDPVAGVRRRTALVIVDEAYVEFGGDTSLPLVAEHPNVVVVRTFSKAFALAGARIGYVLGIAGGRRGPRSASASRTT